MSVSTPQPQLDLIWRRDDMPARMKKFLAWIASHREGFAFGVQFAANYMCEKYGVTRSTVERYIRESKKRGLLTLNKIRGQKRFTWVLNWDVLQALNDEELAEVHEKTKAKTNAFYHRKYQVPYIEEIEEIEEIEHGPEKAQVLKTEEIDNSTQKPDTKSSRKHQPAGPAPKNLQKDPAPAHGDIRQVAPAAKKSGPLFEVLVDNEWLTIPRAIGEERVTLDEFKNICRVAFFPYRNELMLKRVLDVVDKKAVYEAVGAARKWATSLRSGKPFLMSLVKVHKSRKPVSFDDFADELLLLPPEKVERMKKRMTPAEGLDYARKFHGGSK